MKQWTVRMKLTYETIATVEAEDAADALESAETLDLADDGMSGASVTDWEVIGEPKEEKA